MSYSRKIYLINPKFQIRFSLYVCIIVFVTSIIYPFTIYSLMNNIIVFFSLKNPEIASMYESKRDSLVFFLVLLHLGFTCLTFLTCIFFSHKIAGPLYKLKKHLAEIRANGIKDHVFFRKGDYFLEVADEVNQTFDLIHDSYKNDLIYLGEVNSYINNLSLVVPDDKKIILHEISTKLSEMQERYVSKN